MKLNKLVFCFLFVFSMTLFSQNKFSSVDKIVEAYPSKYRSIELLANKINRDFSKSSDRSRAIYKWITNNISYDIDLFNDLRQNPQYAFTYSSNEDRVDKQKKYYSSMASQTLKYNKGICDGYSSLFYVLCELCDVECEVVVGSALSAPSDIGNYPSKINHSWNAVRIANKWYLIDSTWGAGTSDGYDFTRNPTDSFYLQDPKDFALRHFPDYDFWLLDKISKSDIKNKPFFHNEYFEENIELLKPQDGIIRYSQNEEIEIIIKAKNNYFFYSFDYMRFGEEAKVLSEGGKHKFNVKINKQNGYLTVFYFKSPIISFKIIQ